jgi:hypothetical protein
MFRVEAPGESAFIHGKTPSTRRGTSDGVGDTVHPFPTFSEAFKHACQSFRRDRSTMSCCVE